MAPLGDDISQHPYVGYNDITYAPSDDGFLYAFDKEGEEKWKIEIDGFMVYSSGILSKDETKYFVATEEGSVFAINIEGDEPESKYL